MMSTRVDRLTNALDAMGCPNPRSVAVLTLEVWDEIEEAMLLENVTSLGAKLTEERGARYGHPRDNFRRIGRKWAADLDLPEPIPPHMVAIMMVDVKTCRLIETPDDEDSTDDIDGYTETLRMLFR